MAASELESGHLVGQLPFIRFGGGSRKLVIFPPINDSLRDVTESAFQNRLAGSWHRSGEAPLACRDAKLPARCIHRDGRSTGFETRSKGARLLRWYYRRFTGEYTVYLVSRKRGLPSSYTTRDTVADYARSFERSTGSAHVLGLSLGGLMARHFAYQEWENGPRG